MSKFELSINNIVMDSTYKTGKLIVSKNPKIWESRPRSDGSRSKYVKVNLYNQYLPEMSYTDRDHRFEVENRDQFVTKGFKDVHGNPIIKAKISFPLPIHTVDFSHAETDEKVTVTLDNDFRITVSVTIPKGITAIGAENDNKLKVYNVRAEDILKGRAAPPEILVFQKKMVHDTAHNTSFVQWIENQDTKQILINNRYIFQSAEDLQKGLVKVKLYPSKKYKVSVVHQSIDENDKKVFHREYENNGEAVKGDVVLRRIRTAKDLYKNNLLQEHQGHKEDVITEEKDEMEL